jgi:HSP20 family protein
MTKHGRQSSEAGAGATAVQERPEQPLSGVAAEGNGATETGTRRAVTRWPALLAGVPTSPWELMRRMSEEMNQLFESLGGSGAGLAPHIEIQQRPGEVVLRADLPGLRPEDINVTVDNGALTISGERREQHREEREDFIRSELSYGTFFRTIPLPEGADENRVSAILRNGVLEITVPVSDREQGRRVKVQS